jgi:hypothetical protein
LGWVLKGLFFGRAKYADNLLTLLFIRVGNHCHSF